MSSVIENPKLDNEEDFAEDIAQAIEEVYLSIQLLIWYIKFILFFYFFASNFFGKGYFYGPVQISYLFLLLSQALFPIVQERDEVIK